MQLFFLHAIVYLTAAIIAVPIASRLGLGSVLGYLFAGIIIGPVLGLVGAETTSIQHFAEFGVVMMLFVVGLELEPKALWGMRAHLLGLGGLQVTLTALAITGIAMLFGLYWSVALATGLVLALSSTAIVLQTLGEKGLMGSDGGKASFSVLLFQDIAVIPMLALIPLLAMPELSPMAAPEESGGGGHGASLSLVEHLPGWGIALVTLAAIFGIVIGGHYLSRPLFRFIASSGQREMFTAAALLFVIGIAFLMTLVGLSPALGTFLGGVVLANSEYRHELESNIEPFKGLLLGLFFITVGAGINFALFFENPFLVLGLALAVMAVKILVLLLLAKQFKLSLSNKWLFALGLSQAGEFGFVLLSFTVQNAVIPDNLAQLLLLVIAITMLLTPVMFIIYERILMPKFETKDDREADEITEINPVIIVGAGRIGGIIARILRAAGKKITVLDYQSERLDTIRSVGQIAYYGDGTRPDLLHAAGLKTAKMLVIAIADKEKSTDLVRYARHENPDIHIVVSAHDRHHVYELYQAGADDIIRSTFDSAVRAARSALEGLGVHPYHAEKMVSKFEMHDKRLLRELAHVYDPELSILQNKPYRTLLQRNTAVEEALLRGEAEKAYELIDESWDPNEEDESITSEGVNEPTPPKDTQTEPKTQESA